MLADGNIVLPAVFQGQAIFGGFNAAAPVSAKTTFLVGDGQGFGNPAFFTGSLGTATFANPFVASEGLYWDTLTFDVSPEVGAGSNAGDSQITLSSDCLLWPAQAFSVSSAKPSPVPATSAVVKATTDGHTAIDPRGLALMMCRPSPIESLQSCKAGSSKTRPLTSTPSPASWPTVFRRRSCLREAHRR